MSIVRTDPVILPSLRPANYCRVLINVKVDKEKDNLDAMTIVKVLLVWVLVESFFLCFPSVLFPSLYGGFLAVSDLPLDSFW